MTERSFDEMIAYFNRRVASMDINQYYKMELLGMVTALGFKHEKSAPQWIPCSERLPKENECVGNVWKYYLIQDEYEDMHVAHLSSRGWETIESFKALECDVVAWMPLPEPYREDGEE